MRTRKTTAKTEEKSKTPSVPLCILCGFPVQRAGAAEAAASAVPGVEMSILVTGPSAANGFSKSLRLPTTSTANCSGWTYF